MFYDEVNGRSSKGPYLDQSSPPTRSGAPHTVRRFARSPRPEEEEIYVRRDYLTNATIDSVVKFAMRAGEVYPLMYDRVVRCLGWRPDMTIFDEDVR